VEGRGPALRRLLYLPRRARYGIALAVVGLAIAAHVAVIPPGEPHYLTMVPAVVLSGLVGGLGPGIAATLLGGAAASYLSLPSVSSLATADRGDLAGVVVLTGTGILISLLSEAWRRAAAAEQEARRHAERVSRAKDEFLAVLAHELRTPLNATLGWASLLNAGILTPEKVRHATEAIERNARAEALLVESLLDLSSIIEGKLRLTAEPLDLEAVVQAAAEMLRPEADAKGVALEVGDHAPHPVILVGDASRLQQVFWNLLSNAVKFTPRGGRVATRLTVAKDNVRVEVRDSGQGISAEFLPHAFDRFAQAESARAHPHAGLGLGLAIVRELVEAHGGTVAAESAGEGKGSTFIVTLPLASVSDRGDPGAGTPGAGPDGKAVAGNPWPPRRLWRHRRAALRRARARAI
jgi:signal transduction histidine kinase